MDNDALRTLAAATISRTRTVLFGIAVVVIVFLIAMSIQSSNTGDTAFAWIMRILLVAMIVSLNWVRKIRPTPDSVPTLRYMRDRASEIHAIVGIERGSQYLAVTRSDGALLAPPMEIVGAVNAASLEDIVPAYRSDAPPSPKLEAALRLAARVCPNATIATARDNVGITSLAKLAREATVRVANSEPSERRDV
jgi:hypothetical protein